MGIIEHLSAVLKEVMGSAFSGDKWKAELDAEAGKRLFLAVGKKAAVIVGSSFVLTRIMQDRELHGIFTVADGVEIYDSKGYGKKHRGLVGKLNDTLIVLHDHEVDRVIVQKMMVVYKKEDGDVLSSN